LVENKFKNGESVHDIKVILKSSSQKKNQFLKTSIISDVENNGGKDIYAVVAV